MARPPKVTPALDQADPNIPVGPSGPAGVGELVPATITQAWVQLATALGQGLPHGLNRAKRSSRRMMGAIR